MIMMTTASVPWPRTMERAVAARRISTRMFRNWARRMARGEMRRGGSSSLGPHSRSRRAASSRLNPAGPARSRWKHSSTDKVCQGIRGPEVCSIGYSSERRMPMARKA